MQTVAQSAGVLEQATLVFTLALALALVIERLLELLKSLFDMIDSRRQWRVYWTRRAQQTRDYLERRLRVFEYVDRKEAAGLLDRFDGMMLVPSPQHSPDVPVLTGDLVRVLWVRTGSKILGMLVGVGIAFLVRLDLLAWVSAQPREPRAWSMIVTGLALGLGADPMHKIISEIEKRRQKAEEGSGA